VNFNGDIMKEINLTQKSEKIMNPYLLLSIIICICCGFVCLGTRNIFPLIVSSILTILIFVVREFNIDD
jgi:hypothetical protein